ncbi:hypothetical protein L6164_025769 [Bauhinia variegata]|uniref:Uncharacterized protein n=1 Tax=Bauhinia variegata TaxID=167791 RepID=A0ACB9M1V1_BAUVA|nr:hypothetical protein L6164_025769 [Bauhinia variegata]
MALSFTSQPQLQPQYYSFGRHGHRVSPQLRSLSTAVSNIVSQLPQPQKNNHHDSNQKLKLFSSPNHAPKRSLTKPAVAKIINALLHHSDHDHDKDRNPLTLSDEQILEEIYETHVHSDTKFDIESLFILVDNILKRSTHVVDGVLQGTHANLDHLEEKIPKANYNPPLCTLKNISSEISCKTPGDVTAHRVTVAILQKLKEYSWDAKAVLTLAAFAQEYGEFSLLAQLQSTNTLAKSVAILNKVPALTKPAAVQKHRNAIIELNNLVKVTLQVIEAIFELEKLTTYDVRDVPALETAIEQIPVDVFWTIITVVSIVIQIHALTDELDEKQELFPYGQKINTILAKLRKQIALINEQKEYAEYQKSIWKLLKTPTEIVEVFKLLFFWKNVPKTPIYDTTTKTLVELDVLKKKNVFLFISTLDITEDEYNDLYPVYEKIKTETSYTILWVPIVEQWTDDLKKKFEILKAKIPGFVLQHFEPIVGLNFIKEKWQFKKKPLFVTLSPQGKVLHENAFHLLQVYGIKGFPFTKTIEEKITKETSWIESLVKDIHPKIQQWIREERYIFFYGGKDKDWIQQFTKHATAIANDASVKGLKITIELFNVENEPQNKVGRFWKGVESLFLTSVTTTTTTITQDVQKLLSYKNESGWSVLTKGSQVVVAGHGTSFLQTLVEFDKWKVNLPKLGFEVVVNDHHKHVVKATHRCSHLEVPQVAGKIPEIIKCPECDRPMEVFVSYKCCHDKSAASATA